MKKIISLLFICIFTFILTGCSKPAISGSYECFDFYDEDEKVILNLDLNSNKSFTYKSASEEVKGKYSYKLEDKTFENYRYYMVTLTANEHNGEKLDSEKSIEFEFAFAKKGSKKEGLVLFTSSYNMYYCKNY